MRLSYIWVEYLELKFELDWIQIDYYLIQVGFGLIINSTNQPKLRPWFLIPLTSFTLNFKVLKMTWYEVWNF